MKQLFQISLIALFSLSFFATDAQAQEFRKMDSSPLDVAYVKDKETKEPIMRVMYSRPQVKERVIFGELVPYGEVWRTGANEATEIMFFRDVEIAGVPVEAGRYELFTIPGEDQWTFIIYGKTDEWGAYGYEQSYDILRAEVEPQTVDEPIEALSMGFSEHEEGVNLQLGWANTLVQLPIKYEEK